MKHTFFTIAIAIATFCFLIATGKAQAQTLQFSQVLMISSTQGTVPLGKVWKVTSYWQANTSFTANIEINPCNNIYDHHPFQINGNNYYIFGGSPGHGINSTYYVFVAVGNEFPIWLPAGTTLKTICSKDFLSVIEFTVVP